MRLKAIIVSTLTLLILLLGGVFYYASHKINGDELRKFMVSSLENVFPYAKIDVGEVRLKFGSSLNLTVEGLYLTMPEKMAPARDLFKIQKMGIEIPLLSVLGFERSITVNLDGSLINFAQDNNGISNWADAFQKGGSSGTNPAFPEGRR